MTSQAKIAKEEQNKNIFETGSLRVATEGH